MKKCKKKGTRIKHRYDTLTQRSIGGGHAFVSERDCKICAAKLMLKNGIIDTIPHKQHHRRCRFNRKTRGMSERWVEVNRVAAANLAMNSAPLPKAPMQMAAFQRNNPSVLDYFGGVGVTQQTMVRMNHPTIADNNGTDGKLASSATNDDIGLAEASHLRGVLDDLMETFKDDQKYEDEFVGSASKPTN